MADTISGKRAAESAARAAMNERVGLVAAIGEAQDQHTKALTALTSAQQAADAAAAAVRESFAVAARGGWSMKELKAMGLTAPPAATPRRKTSKAGTPATDYDQQADATSAPSLA